MRYPSPNSTRSALIILAVIFSLFMAPLYPLAAASRNRLAARAATSSATTTAPATLLAPAPVAQPTPDAPSAVNITATKTASFTDADGDGKAELGQTINYTVTINNSGTTDATAVQFSDTVDPKTTFVAGSAHASPIALPETYTTISNTLLEAGVTASGNPAVTSAIKLFDNDTISTSPDTIQLQSVQNPSANGGTVTVNADGSFTYLPAAGFSGTDTFTYTIRNSAVNSLQDTATVTVNVNTPKVWYVNSAAAGGGDGRSSTPFNSLASVSGATGPDAAGDIIYLFSSASNYAGGITLLNNQQLIGGGVALVVNTLTLKGAGTRPNITNGTGNGVTLASGNTLNGFNVGDTSGIDITGTSFGTLTVNNVALTGTGRPLSLTTGALAATFDSITSTSSSGGQGISIAGATGTMAVTNGTSITSPTTQCILVGTTSANINFGNTTCSGGTDGVSFQNNSAGTRTFGTLGVSGGSGSAFLSGAGGGNVTVTGAATLSSTGNPIDIQNMTNGSAISFAATTVSKTTAGGAGINWGGTNTGATLGFASLGLTTGNGPGLVAAGGGTINVTTGTISSTGGAAQAAPAISSNGVTLGATFTSVSSTNSGNSGNGISLTNTPGTLTMSGGSISGAAGDAFVVSGVTNSTANITYNGTISTSAARPVNISGKTGGTVAFGGAISSTSNGVSLNSNTGATINFTGGLSLSTGANTAFSATAGGTVNATQNNTTIVNTLTTTTGTALNVNATTIGASGLTFRNITSNGSGSNNGIVLDTTGTSGGLTVTGNGGTCTSSATCTGGTISNKTGTDSATTSGIGIYLNNTSNVSLDRMQLNDFQNFAILGTTVRSFTLTNSTINGTNGTNENIDEGSVAFTNLLGSATITNVNVSGAIEDNFRVINNVDRTIAGNPLNRITFTNFTLGANSTAVGDNGLFIQAQLNAEINVTIQNSTFTSARGDIFQFDLTNTAKGDLIFQNNAVSNNHPAIVVGGGGITLSGGGSTNSNVNFTYDINTNSFRDARGDLLLIALQTGGGTFSGKIRNNTFGVAAVDQSGGREATSVEVRTVGSGNQVVQIDNNQIRQYGNFGILLQVGGQTANGNGSAGSMNATVTNNIINTPSSFVFIKNGFQLNSGTNAGDAFQVCLHLSGNTLAGSGQNGGTDFQLRNRFTTTDRLPGYGGANNNNAAVVAFIQSQNAGGPTGTVSNNVAGGSGGFVGGASCTTPARPSISETPDRETASKPAVAPANASSDSTPSMLDAPSSLSSGRPFVVIPRPAQQPVQRPAQSATVTTNRTRPATTQAAAPKATGAPSSPDANLPVSIGTLTAGKTVTIQFQVTVNNPFPAGSNSVSNQGTVSGSNFASVLTDDPAVAGSSNPTVTPVDAVTLSINDVSVAEGAVGQRTVTLTLNLSQTTNAGAFTVHYQTANNTATAPADYMAVPDTVLNVPGNSLTQTFTVLVNGDTLFEGNENFFVNLSSPTGNAALLNTQSIVTIADDEPQVADLSGDGLTDAAVWNSNNGNWLLINSGSSTPTLAADDWGRAALGDIAVPGDYDGDNKIDIAIFRPSEGNWYILKSSTPGVPSAQNWGLNGDIPVPGDYDGDGKTDLAVFRPSQGNWYILKSSGGNTVQNWGAAADKPVVGDFDGDGKTDVAVFRPAEGNWYILNSGTGTITIQSWGTSTDKLVPGDYDGDGKTDMAIYRAGVWFIRNSSGGSTVKNWGNATDVVIPGDYDGDGKFDISVWRPSEGNFYTIKSSDNTVLLQTIEVGGAGIVPVPNAYLPQ